MKHLQLQSDRKIRDDQTFSLKQPEIYDMTDSLDRLKMLEREAKQRNQPFYLQRVCNTTTPIYYPYTRETGIHKLLYCVQGQALLVGENSETHFLTSGSIIIVPANIEYDLLLGRGVQNWITAHWDPESAQIDSRNLNDLRYTITNNCSQSCIQITQQLLNLGDEATGSPNLILAWINLLIYEMARSTSSFSLTPPFEDDLENLDGLVREIKLSPERDWNLNVAAKQAGYSPFHLSRVFRSSIGVGLPKFVESCRTEVAINRLIHGTDAINIVADECGFGSSQAMRTAIRELTGFLPIELRGRSGE